MIDRLVRAKRCVACRHRHQGASVPGTASDAVELPGPRVPGVQGSVRRALRQAKRAGPRPGSRQRGELDPLLAELEPARFDQSRCPKEQRLGVLPRQRRHAMDFSLCAIGQAAMVDPEIGAEGDEPGCAVAPCEARSERGGAFGDDRLNGERQGRGGKHHGASRMNTLRASILW